MEQSKNAKKSPVKKGLMIFVIVAAVLASLAVLIKNGVFLSKPDKVLQAFYNSCKENNLIQVFSEKTAEYTTEIELSDEEVTLSVEIASAQQKKEVHFSVGSHGISTEGTAVLDAEQLTVQMPLLGYTVFAYNYRQENTGFFAEVLENAGISQEDWNHALAEAVSDTDTVMEEKEAGKLLLNVFRSLSFETIEKKSLKVNGTMQNCTGYRTVVTSSDIKMLLEGIEKIQGDGYRMWCDRILRLVGSDYETFLKELMRQENLYVNFYIYRNKLVEISVDNKECTVMNLYFAKDAMLSVDINSLTLDEKTCTGTIRLTEGAEIEELTGNRIDIGNATKEDLLGIAFGKIFGL